MKFEYDSAKSAENLRKHEIGFEEAKRLWDDPHLVEAPAKSVDEPRFLAVGMIGSRHWTAIYTYRAGRIRIISVRRSRKREWEHYESE